MAVPPLVAIRYLLCFGFDIYKIICRFKKKKNKKNGKLIDYLNQYPIYHTCTVETHKILLEIIDPPIYSKNILKIK